jgi:hypothetical protein
MDNRLRAAFQALIAIGAFREKVSRLWFKVLKRRSDKHRLTWDRMNRLIARYIPAARVCHPQKTEGSKNRRVKSPNKKQKGQISKNQKMGSQ